MTTMRSSVSGLVGIPRPGRPCLITGHHDCNIPYFVCQTHVYSCRVGGAAIDALLSPSGRIVYRMSELSIVNSANLSETKDSSGTVQPPIRDQSRPGHQ